MSFKSFWRILIGVSIQRFGMMQQFGTMQPFGMMQQFETMQQFGMFQQFFAARS
jgi:hypothetical protein